MECNKLRALDAIVGDDRAYATKALLAMGKVIEKTAEISGKLTEFSERAKDIKKRLIEGQNALSKLKISPVEEFAPSKNLTSEDVKRAAIAKQQELVEAIIVESAELTMELFELVTINKT